MRLDPPKILLEHSFLHAIADATHPRHADALAIYLPLVTRYEAEQVLLVAVSDHLRDFRDWRHLGPLAPVDELYVGHQHRRAAGRMDPDDFDRSLTLVMCERHQVRRIATFDHAFEQYDLEIERPAAPAADPTMQETAQAAAELWPVAEGSAITTSADAD